MAKRRSDGSDSDDEGFVIIQGKKRGTFPGFQHPIPTDLSALTSMDSVARKATKKRFEAVMRLPPPADNMPPLPGAKHRRDAINQRSVAALAYRRANSMPGYDYPTKRRQLDAELSVARADRKPDVTRKTAWRTKAGLVPGVSPRAATSMDVRNAGDDGVERLHTPQFDEYGRPIPPPPPPKPKIFLPPNEASLGVFQPEQPYDFKKFLVPPKARTEATEANPNALPDITAKPGSLVWMRQLKDVKRAKIRAGMSPLL
jgi:hypothetical protein